MAVREAKRGGSKRRATFEVRSGLPAMISCDIFHDLVPGYLSDRLERSDRRRFELHRKACDDCRAHLTRSTESLQTTVDREWRRRDADRP